MKQKIVQTLLSASLLALFATSAYADCPSPGEIHPDKANPDIWITDSGWKSIYVSELRGTEMALGAVVFNANPTNDGISQGGPNIGGQIVWCQYITNNQGGAMSLAPPEHVASILRSATVGNQPSWNQSPPSLEPTGREYMCLADSGSGCKFEITLINRTTVRENPF
jgi:hypothetical protein